MRDDQDSETSFAKHPALRNFNRMAFMTQHVVKNTLKWGAIGAVAGVGALAAMALGALIVTAPISAPVGILSVLLSKVPLIGDAIGWIAGGVVGTAFSGGIYMAAAGAVIGAAAGAIVGISGASEAADAEEDRLVAKFEQAEARRDRMAALERRRDEQRFAMENQEIAMRSPNLQIPRGRAAQQRLGNTPA